MKRNSVVILFLALLMLMMSSVSADDGRINRTPYHFGGDTLYCNQAEGCTLLDKTGHDLAHWSQDAVATALSNADKLGQKLMVDGEGKGTYGPMQLWAMPGEKADGSSTLCMVGFDEWDKQNDMCFDVTQDWHYLQAPLPVATEVVGAAVDHSCDPFKVGDFVALKSNISIQGTISSIDLTAHTVTFTALTFKCSEVKIVT